MSSFRRVKPKVILDDDDEDDGDHPIVKKSTTTTFKRRKPINPIVIHNPVSQDDDEEEEDGVKLNIKINKKRNTELLQKVGESDLDMVETIQTTSIRDVLNRYTDNSQSVPPPAMTEVNESPPIVPTQSQIKELKERRYRSQLPEFDELKQQDLKDDYDSDHEYKTTHRDDDMDMDMDVDIDRDERFTDGRLAVSTNEQKLQQLLQRDEIEEALYHAQLSNSSDSEEDDDSFKLELELDNDDSRLLNDDIINLDSVGKKAKVKDNWTLPKLRIPPNLQTELENLKQQRSNLQQVIDKNKITLTQLKDTSNTLKDNKQQLLQSMNDLLI
ncbi:hypothetical protein CANARDRAFT_51733 [[Candida] arabinofermentans NRRL YB-2248]|uniref:Uncharacterized protein n=1 Tax=[Candida] arabinofermentans NRRL YB-2248 TaxID=983967 RepID=A0A1E4T7N2_9ASCO|nr:hypothetical protein CANARDRAFT_51733 [[Candida] arabinofermentans NRRL YB-2248]